MFKKILIKKFHTTGDYQWLVKYAQEKFPKSKLKIKVPTVADLIKGMQSVSQRTLKDKGQELLNKATAKALERYYRDVFSVKDSVWQNLNFVHPDIAYDKFIIPNQPEEIQEVARLILDEIDNLYLEDKLRNELIDYIQDHDGLQDAIHHVLYKAYLWLYSLFIYKNPALAITDAESLKKRIPLSIGLTKQAAVAKKGPDRVGPRLSDWREANEFAQGQLMRRIATADTFGVAPQKNDLIALKASDGMNNYWYNRVAEANAALPPGYRLKSHNIEDEDGKHVEMATDNMWVGRAPGTEAPKKGKKWHTDYLRPSIRVPNKVEIKIPHRDGSVDVLKRVQPTAPQLLKFFYDEVKEDDKYLMDMLDRSTNNSQLAIDFYNNPQTKKGQVDALGPTVSIKEPAELTRLYEELLTSIRARIPTDDGLKSTISSKYAEEYTAMRDTDQLDDFFNRYSDEGRAIVNEKIREARNAAISIARSVISDPTSFKRWVDTTIRESLLPVYFFNVNSLRSQHYDPGRIKDITELYKPAFDLVQGRLESPDFQDRFAKNARDYNEYYNANKEGAYIVGVRNGLEKLKSDDPEIKQFLEALGIGSDQLRVTTDKYKAKTKEINGVMKDFAERYSCKDVARLAEASEIPVDSIYAYMGQQMVGLLEENLKKRIVDKYNGAREKNRYTEAGAPVDEAANLSRVTDDTTAAYGEATTYITDQLLQLKASQSKNDSLSIATAPRLVKEWHCNPKLGASRDFEGFTKYFMKNAGDFAFGAFLRDAMDDSVRRMFDENKKDLAVTDENWNSPNDAHPRNRRELMEVTGAFADPGRAAEKYDKRLSDLDESVESGAEIAGDEMVGLDSARSHMLRQIFRLGYAVALTPNLIILTLTDSFNKRAEQLIEEDRNHEKNIVRYKKDNHSETNDPFAYQGFVWAKPSVISLDFDKLDEMSVEDLSAIENETNVSSKDKAIEFISGLSSDTLSISNKNTLREAIKEADASNFKDNETFYSFLLSNAIPELTAFEPGLHVEHILSELADLLGVLLKEEMIDAPTTITPEEEDIPITHERVEINTASPIDDFNIEYGKALKEIKTFIISIDLKRELRNPQDLERIVDQATEYDQALADMMDADLFDIVKKHDPLYKQTMEVYEEITNLQNRLESINSTIVAHLKSLQAKTEGVERAHKAEQQRREYIEGFVNAILKTMQTKNYSPDVIDGVNKTLVTLSRGTPEELASPTSIAEPGYPLIKILRQLYTNISESEPATETYVGLGHPEVLRDLESYVSEYRNKGSYWAEKEE